MYLPQPCWQSLHHYWRDLYFMGHSPYLDQSWHSQTNHWRLKSSHPIWMRCTTLMCSFLDATLANSNVHSWHRSRFGFKGNVDDDGSLKSKRALWVPITVWCSLNISTHQSGNALGAFICDVHSLCIIWTLPSLSARFMTFVHKFGVLGGTKRLACVRIFL